MHRVLVIGTGSIGARHVRCLLATHRTRVGICEPNDALREKVGAEFELLGAYGDLSAALEQRWDAAVIATPAPLHVSIAQQLADRGIGLLIEKPLAVEEEGIARLIETVERRGIPAAVAYVQRAHPAVRAMREAILDGRFGRPLEVTAVSGQHFPFYRPAYREIYYADRSQGGGAIQDALTHTFNTCEWLVGAITRIAVDAAHLRLEGVEVEDTVHALARHGQKGEVLACYALNQHQAPNEGMLKVVCENGAMQLELHRHLWKWADEPGGLWHEERTSIVERDDWFICQQQAFLDHLEGRAPALCSLREGWQTLRVNRAALASVDRGGQWQTIGEGGSA